MGHLSDIVPVHTRAAAAGKKVMALTSDQIRKLSIETSMVAVDNVSVANHTGLVTLQMRNGIVQRVWAGTPEGLLIWRDGKTLFHVIRNVGMPLTHG